MPQFDIELAMRHYASGRKLVSCDGKFSYCDLLTLNLIANVFMVSKTALTIVEIFHDREVCYEHRSRAIY